MNFVDDVSEFSNSDLSTLISTQLLSVLNDEPLSSQNLANLKISLLKEKIFELENLLSKTQEKINDELKAKLPALLDIFKDNKLHNEASPPLQLFYLDFISRLNDVSNGLNDYKELSLQAADNDLVSHINKSEFGLDLAIRYKDDDGIVGQASLERIKFEFNNFIKKQKELSELLSENRNIDEVDFNIKYVFFKKSEKWFVTNNSVQINQFIADTILSDLDGAIVKSLTLAISPYLYNQVEINPDDLFKNVIISSSQSLLALSKSLTYLTDLHFKIKKLDGYLFESQDYISNRLSKWLNLLITSLVWDEDSLYDIFYMGLFVLFFVKIRSFFLPELRSTIGHILSLSKCDESNVISEDLAEYYEEWNDKLGRGAEYQPNPYKGWTPGSPFKGIDIPQSTTSNKFRRLVNSLRILIENTK